MMLDKDLYEYVQCLVRMAREGDAEAMSDAIRFRDYPLVAELIDERLEALQNGMKPHKAFPSPPKLGRFKKSLRDFFTAVGVERAKARGMHEDPAIIAVADAFGLSEATVKAVHQANRDRAKEFLDALAP